MYAIDVSIVTRLDLACLVSEDCSDVNFVRVSFQDFLFQFLLIGK